MLSPEATTSYMEAKRRISSCSPRERWYFAGRSWGKRTTTTSTLIQSRSPTKRDKTPANSEHREERGAPRRRGGFHTEFQGPGGLTDRAAYRADNRIVYVNLDHPQIQAALGGRRPEDPVFRRLRNEGAFFEYAIALASDWRIVVNISTHRIRLSTHARPSIGSRVKRRRSTSHSHRRLLFEGASYPVTAFVFM